MIQSKKLLPHLIALGVFTVLSFVYFSPVLDGRVLQMHDMMQARGSSNELIKYHDKTGVDALWASAMFSGMPSYQIARFPKTQILQSFFNAVQMIFPEP